MRNFIIFTLPNIIRVKKSRRIRQPRHNAHMRQMRNGYKTVARKPEGKMPFGRPWHRWEDDIKIYLKKQGVRMWTGLR
jgi:hypothetical protein